MRQENEGRASRREFLAAGTLTALGAQAATAQGPGQPPRAVEIPAMKAKTEVQDGPPPAPSPPDRRLGFAIVGLGELALGQVLPAFGRCKSARATALVSGDRDKAAQVGRQYGISPEHHYDYKTFDRIIDDPAVDIVYIILPNSMHLEYTVRAAKAGKHVLCEKPMANSSAECEEMISACEKAARRLMIAYRCQYEPYNRELIRLARSEEFGPIRLIEALNGQDQGRPDQWRMKKALAGGGSLPDVGIYCLNAARYITGEEPTRVHAQIVSDPADPRFREVEDRVSFQLQFPSGAMANCQSFYSAHESRRCRVIAERGWIDADPAFAYHGLKLKTSQARGGAELTTEIKLAEKDQFALEMDHMAERVATNQPPLTGGREGLQDLKLIEAIYRAAREGRAVDLPVVPGKDSTRGPALA